MVHERKGKSTQNKPAQGGSQNAATRKSPFVFYKQYGRELITVNILAGLGLAVYFVFVMNESEPTDAYARADRTYDELTYAVKCSTDYKDEPFIDCKPKNCGRVIMDNLVTEEEASNLLSIAKKGLAYGGSSGGASILDLHSGALSKNDKFINVYSVMPPDDGFTEEDFALYRLVKNKIQKAIAEYFGVPLTKLYLTKPTFFSRMNTTEAKTLHDEYWHKHIDKVTYGSFHYTSLLYLTTYGVDFTGGRFIFVDNELEKAVEPRLGRVSFFTSGSENVHYVEKLESGVRYAITISFTCDPEMAIADPDVR